ncbi:MAG: 16S rRNA (uracil(1498)-N(3))-methyltransferase [Vicinamibacteria bacterium]|jgi:16S rRNA (uracil1498-N3)-methyltransferase|nr:16S rRNA (uracil(1498)-N(3))-methyltransferase [Vicinamibacteria bacterium]
MSAPRFYVPQAQAQQTLRLTDETAHHARDVMRLRIGARLLVFDGQGHEFAAEIVGLDRRAAHIQIHEAVASRPESPLHAVMAVPPLKGDLMELVIQKTTELGVSEIWPMLTARTDTVGRPALDGARLVRWQRVAQNAAEQCGRAVLPLVAPARTLHELLTEPFDGPRLVCLETQTPRAFAPCRKVQPARALCLIGPAGGWATEEIEALAQAGCHALSLGPRILRAETAAIIALAELQRRWGDLASAAENEM